MATSDTFLKYKEKSFGQIKEKSKFIWFVFIIFLAFANCKTYYFRSLLSQVVYKAFDLARYSKISNIPNINEAFAVSII